jgi:D-serine deaminase-like pyridoxal phosphate-dependent protein
VQFTDLPTPQVLVDRSRLLANIDHMQAAADRHGVRLRPHAKTHKIPTVARWQIDRGATGICCAKMGEAEVFAEAGVSDIRLPYPLNPRNAPRLLALMDACRISIIVDHPAVARGWSDAMKASGRTLDVLVKVDVGSHRCGIDPALPPALDFLRMVAALPALRLCGILSHAGHSYGAASEQALQAIAQDEAALLRELAAAARTGGIEIEEISVGATPTARFSVAEAGVTELRPGTYTYFDRSQVAFGAATVAECALTVLAMVVSKPAADRIVLDCGSKTLTNDPPHGFDDPTGFGAVFADLDATSIDDDLRVERLSEEHAVVTVRSGRTGLEPGDLVRVLPNHVCPVSNLVDRVQIVEGRDVVDTLAVAARGKVA